AAALPMPTRPHIPVSSRPLPPPLHPPPIPIGAREWALLATVLYADLFESALPLAEAVRGCLGFAPDEAELRRLAAGPALSSLLRIHPDGFLVLAGRDQLVDAVPEREALTRALLEKNRATLLLLSALPFVRALILSGGLAHKNPGTRPDVDLFVLAAAGRAYTAYTMLFLATRLTGTRRLICPNYLVDERELAVAYHRDVFTAHQLVSSLPFAGQRSYEAFCDANAEWVRRFFPAFVARQGTATAPTGVSAACQSAGELALRPIAPLIEGVLRFVWRIRLRRRAAAAAHADVVLADGILKLHLSDYRRRVMARFSERLEALRTQLGSEPHLQRPDRDRTAP
ncbi:MAG: hypothetical protein M3O46_02700, partial [Myxococcota bacterium]|nr:hypothetical protein [Myxococcota bacterium]